MVRVDEHGNYVDGNKAPINRAGFKILSAVHKARPDLNVACHVHSVWGKAFSALGRKLDMLSQEACIFYNNHDVYRNFGGVAVETEEGEKIAKAFGPTNRAMILQNHGLISAGYNVGEACFLLRLMDKVCETQVKTDSVYASGLYDRIVILDEEASFTYRATATSSNLYASFCSDYELQITNPAGRKRKIKCDLLKPACGCCLRSSYECVYGVRAIPKNFKLHKLAHRPIRFVEPNSINLRRKITLLSEDADLELEPTKEAREDALFRKYLQTLGWHLGGYSSWMLGVDLSPSDALLYDAFVKGFMVAISPQLAHENLQPSSVVIPRGLDNPTLRHVFYACGATYLSWKRPEYREFAEQKFLQSMKELRWFLSENSVIGNEDWLLICMVTLCLREKYQCENTARNAFFLIASLQIIECWLLKKSISFESFNQLLDALALNQIDVKILPMVKKDHKINDVTYWTDELSYMLREGDVSNLERTILESFLYNYSVALFACDASVVDYIKSPFQVYAELKPYLLPPIYHCPAWWMNNPIMGAALSAFELAAKTNWLSLFFPLNANNKMVAEKLLTLSKYYLPPVLPENVRFHESDFVQRRLMESCLIGNIVAKACTIMLSKLLNPKLRPDAPEIQEEIDNFFLDLRKLSPHAQSSGLCSWPFAVAGSAVIKEDQRLYLIERIRTFGVMKKSSGLMSVMRFLFTTWGSDTDPGPGWDVLLDKDHLRNTFL
ncbi:hypothetical protein KL930_002403 [Ogataea haglerorum]|nr:hypothetical protein KL930_002403 [Ogataea haglerorum]KAG7779002.1 hypothetical protein KL922_001487 [Ogataea haglerorum]